MPKFKAMCSLPFFHHLNFIFYFFIFYWLIFFNRLVKEFTENIIVIQNDILNINNAVFTQIDANILFKIISSFPSKLPISTFLSSNFFLFLSTIPSVKTHLVIPKYLQNTPSRASLKLKVMSP